MNQQLGGEVLRGNFELKVLKIFWIQTAEQQDLDGECPRKTAEPEVSRIMRDNRQTEIKLTLSSEMVRENDNGSFSLQDKFFRIEVIKNLRATDESHVLDVLCKHLTKEFRILSKEETTGDIIE